MNEFKYLGKKSEDFIERFVEIPLQGDAKKELNELLEEMYKTTKIIIMENKNVRS